MLAKVAQTFQFRAIHYQHIRNRGTPMSEKPPAGWYPDNTGTTRWWDGDQWTDHQPPPPPTQSLAADASEPAPATAPAQPHTEAQAPARTRADAKAEKAYAKASRPWYKKKRIIIPIALLVFIGIGSAVGGGGGTGSDSGPKEEEAVSGDAAAESNDAAAPESKEDNASNPDEGVFQIRVTSTGSSSANSITYMQPDGKFETSQQNGKPLPWKKRWTGVDSVPLGWNMNAQQNGGGEIKCVVKHDGKVVADNTSSGNYAVVTCTP